MELDAYLAQITSTVLVVVWLYIFIKGDRSDYVDTGASYWLLVLVNMFITALSVGV